MSTVSPPLPFNLRPDEASPEWMNKGDNAWQLIAATLVGLQSVPGLMILYGGAVKKKWAVNSAFMAFYAFACVLVCWVLWGYRMAFGDTMILCWGFPNVALDEAYLLNPTYEEGFASSRFPIATMVYFQFVFAAITLVLIAGSLLGRMNFYAWMLFVPLWLTFSYTVGAFSIWSPKGFLSKARILDFAGGYVIHLSSGVAGFTAAHWVGPRLSTDREKFPPNNMLLMLAGAGLLWMGWSGFNGGATYAASVDSSMAILNTHVCTATSLLTWLILDFFAFGKASVIGAVHGMITGLVCITPAAGFVECWAAMLMGLCSGSIPWYTMMVLHKDFNLLQKVDDTMGVVHTHAIAGSLGGLLVGLFGKPELICLAFNIPEPCPNVGLFYVFRTGRVKDGFHQIGMQLLGIVFIVVLNVIVTTIICLLVQLVVPLRIPDEDLAIGDEAVHEEKAYTI